MTQETGPVAVPSTQPQPYAEVSLLTMSPVAHDNQHPVLSVHAFDCPLPMRGGGCTCQHEAELVPHPQMDWSLIHDQVWAEGDEAQA